MYTHTYDVHIVCMCKRNKITLTVVQKTKKINTPISQPYLKIYHAAEFEKGYLQIYSIRRYRS